MKRKWFTIVFFLFLFALTIPATLMGQKLESAKANEGPAISPLVKAPPTDQIIIKFSDDSAATDLLQASRTGSLPQLSQVAEQPLTYKRPMSGDAHVLKLSQALPALEVAAIAARLSEIDGVEYAEPDLIKVIDGRPSKILYAPNLTPNDTFYTNQWHYRYTPGTAEGINLEPAWNITTGISSTVVAVIDTGILNHTDLAGKTVPGYDFITDVPTANDGDGRDADPSDPGDWVIANQCGAGKPALDSSWHGTHVAGTIAAASNNNIGVAGVNWNAKILPVRVLGRCGGFTSDILDGMRWSAGLSVPGVPNNSNPADVLNLSLGGPGSCLMVEQNAIDAIVAAGSTVVIAAGNENDDAANYGPGSCDNIITVAANDRGGDKASYSNFGSVVEVSAPGGETSPTPANGVLSTLDSGTTTPANDNVFAYYQGTSMATPHVAGVASLIMGQNPAYTPDQVSQLLQLTARSFPGGSSCTTSLCGAGIVDAFRALSDVNFVYIPAVLKPSVPNPLTNPGFESGTTGWTEFSAQGLPLILNSGFPTGVTPHGGSWAAWLGGAYDEISYLEQQVTIPVNTPVLAYWHWIASQDICGYDFAGILVNGNIVEVYDLCDPADTNGWVQKTVNLSAYAGQTVALQIRVETDNSLNSNLFVDDVSFQTVMVTSQEATPGSNSQGQPEVPKQP